jgi:predicted nucleic acid-binding protein
VSHLLDTNVLSETRRRQPDPGVLAWLATVRPNELFVSVLVIGELRAGVDRLARRDAVQADALGRWLEQLTTVYEDRIVPITLEIAQEWGRLTVPDRLPAVDGLLAATALVNDWTLVTRNTADVESTGVRLLNPFGAPQLSKR